MRNIKIRAHKSSAKLKKEDQLAWKIAEIAADKSRPSAETIEMVINRIIDNASVAIASPITVLPFNVVCPSTVTSESNCALFVTFILSLNTALAVTVNKSLFALPIVASLEGVQLVPSGATLLQSLS